MIYLSRVLRSSSSESRFSIFSSTFLEISIANWSKKRIEHSPQNPPGEFPGGVRGPLWSHLEANRADFERRRRSVKPLKRPGHLPHTSRTPPAHLPDVISEAQPRAAGLPKRLKNAFFAQKVVAGSVSGDNSCRLWGYHRFGLIFWSKNTVFFIIFASLFLHQKTQIMKQTWWFQLGSKPWKLLFFLRKTSIFKVCCLTQIITSVS